MAALILALLTSCRDRPVDAVARLDVDAPEILLQETIESFEQASFSDEQEARHFENEGIVPFWDQLLATAPDQRLSILSRVPFQRLQLGTTEGEEHHDLGVLRKTFRQGGKSLLPSEWLESVSAYQEQGFILAHSDWHHEAFQRDPDGRARSEIRFKLLGTRQNETDRLEIKGTVAVLWDERGPRPVPESVTVLQARLVRRDGAFAFRRRAVIEGDFGNRGSSVRNDMGAICVYDLNQDQLPEILLGNANRILWNQGNFQFRPAPLIPERGQVFRSVVGLVADVTGDAVPDWICDTGAGALALYAGRTGGGFSAYPRKIDLGDQALKIPTCLSAGDIDHDGDLDLFAGQWRSLYDQMPEKFWDANDGFGNTLLLNDGEGNFQDVTADRGLADRRHRRTYSASFLDLDDDHDLDLFVVSDFRGVDVFLNDGGGHFTEATARTVDQPHLFGMSHTVADYNLDGLPDLFVLGMGSTTARRLERMGARPSEHPETNRMRATMGYGNRMYLRGAHGYQAPSYMDTIARTGWCWGSTSFDFDNDGDQDIYIANGHISGTSTRDYCSNFWCRDIYLLKNRPASVIDDYLRRLPDIQRQSWDGFQVNSLLVNQQGTGFQNFGFLLDVGFTFDARRVISADLDLDGRVDLLVGRMEGTSGFFHDGQSAATPPALLVLQNTLETGAERNWIGVTLSAGTGASPQGARVEAIGPFTPQRGIVLSGDSFSCQHPAMKHFGLGAGSEVSELRVTWPDGRTTSLKNPAINRYHAMRPPG